MRKQIIKFGVKLKYSCEVGQNYFIDTGQFDIVLMCVIKLESCKSLH